MKKCNLISVCLYFSIFRNDLKHLIELSCDKGTSYDFYLKVRNGFSETYLKLREEKSKELYKKTFSELTKSEKEKIKKVYPQNIKEQ